MQIDSNSIKKPVFRRIFFVPEPVAEIPGPPDGPLCYPMGPHCYPGFRGPKEDKGQKGLMRKPGETVIHHRFFGFCHYFSKDTITFLDDLGRNWHWIYKLLPAGGKSPDQFILIFQSVI